MMKEIVEERDDLLKANQILQALIGNRDKEVDRLREALRPFAAQVECWPEIPDNQAMMTSNGEDLSSLDFLMSDLRRASALVGGVPK